MFEINNFIYTGLVNNAAVTAEFGSEIYPLIAPNKAKEPFLVFSFKMLTPISKDGIREFEIVIHNYSKKHDDALAGADIIDGAMNVLTPNDGKQYRLIRGIKEPLLTEDFEIYIEQKFNIKL